MRVLVTGVKGQLGHDVVNEMEKRGITPIGVDLAEMDITDKEACDRVITEANVDAVIHCAAYTAVDAAEDNVDESQRRRNEKHRGSLQKTRHQDDVHQHGLCIRRTGNPPVGAG